MSDHDHLRRPALATPSLGRDVPAPGKRARTDGLVQRKGGARPPGLPFMDVAQQSALAESIQYLEERASELLGHGKPGPRETRIEHRIDDLGTAAQMVIDQLLRTNQELDQHAQAALRHAIARMAEVGQVLGGNAAAELRQHRERLIAVAAEHGVDARAPIAAPDGMAPLPGEADDARLLDDLERRIGLIVDALGPHAEAPRFTDVLAGSTESILALLRQAEGVIRGADTRDMERFSRQVLAIKDHIDRLTRRARSAEAPLLTTELDEIFEVERRVLLAIGASSGNRLREYYGQQRVDDKDPRTSGEALIDAIVAQFTNAAEVHKSAISVVESILQAPEQPAPPSLLKEVLLSVISDFIGGLPGHFGKLLENVARRASEATNAAGAPATAGPFAAGLFNTAKRVVAYGAGEVKTETKGAFESDRPTSGAEMKLAFIEQVHRNTIDYMAGPLHENARDMVFHLRRVPPEHLVKLHEQMTEGLELLYPLLVRDLLAQWMNFRAGIALGGIDELGDLAMNGRLDAIIERTGAVRVSLGVDAAADAVEVLGVEVNGISDAVKKKLTSGGVIPLTELPVHRFFQLQGPPTAGGREQYGEIYLNASGELRLDRLLRPERLVSTARPFARPDEAEVSQAARGILIRVPLTTKDLI